jgi:hypothetical protein
VSRAIARSVLWTALSFASVACSEAAPASTQQAIVGGAATAPGAWPFLAWLDNGCTGVLVAPNVVLSAGHCGEATTAWFGDELEIVLAHEGTTVEPSAAATQIGIEMCRVHAESELGDGRRPGPAHRRR